MTVCVLQVNFSVNSISVQDTLYFFSSQINTKQWEIFAFPPFQCFLGFTDHWLVLGYQCVGPQSPTRTETLFIILSYTVALGEKSSLTLLYYQFVFIPNKTN